VLGLLRRSGLLSLLKRAGLLDGVIRQMATDSLRHVPFTQLANLTGTPAISLPLHWTADGLPLGVQFMAAPAQESLLLQLATELEQAQPWSHRLPPDFS
jgi:amidase